jgi:hypothetical protein
VVLHNSGRFAFVAVKKMVVKHADALSMILVLCPRDPSNKERHSFRELSAMGREVVGKFVNEEIKASKMTGCKHMSNMMLLLD